jgi:hypothetical protein
VQEIQRVLLAGLKLRDGDLVDAGTAAILLDPLD